MDAARHRGPSREVFLRTIFHSIERWRKRVACTSAQHTQENFTPSQTTQGTTKSYKGQLMTKIHK